MSAKKFKTIVLKGDLLRFEATAGAATILPGHMIQYTSATIDTVVIHATPGGDDKGMVAIENALQADEIEDLYSTSARVQIVAPKSGDELNMILADGEDITKGDILESKGNGTLRAHTTPATNSDGAFDEGGETIYTRAGVYMALETIDLSTSSNLSATSRIMVRKL